MIELSIPLFLVLLFIAFIVGLIIGVQIVLGISFKK